MSGQGHVGVDAPACPADTNCSHLNSAGPQCVENRRNSAYPLWRVTSCQRSEIAGLANQVGIDIVDMVLFDDGER